MLHATSISQHIADWVRAPHSTAHVLASFDAACNLLTDDGRVVAVVRASIGNGPLNIVVTGQAAFGDVQPGSPVARTGGQLVIGRLPKSWEVIALDRAATWDPRLAWARLEASTPPFAENVAALSAYLLTHRANAGLLALLADGEPPATPGYDATFRQTARRATRGLLDALSRSDEAGVDRHTAALAGLGPGLTPAGDDYLLGLMAGLRLWPPAGQPVESLCARIGRVAAGRTNRLSAALLRCAARGLFAAAWHDLAAALASAGPAAVIAAAERILGHGATSGADALAGFLSPRLIFQRAPGIAQSRRL